jgi:frataxin-like iron-binding protein CyaY
MTQRDFESLASATVQSTMFQLEAQDVDAILDMDDSPDGLTIDFPTGKQLVVSIHRASGELWLASPISGGLHFRQQEASPFWRLPDGRDFFAVLESDIHTLSKQTHWQLREEIGE